MKNLNVSLTRKLDLCVSCEICFATCPEFAISMENKNGQFLPKVNDEKCTNCGLCFRYCPGIDIDPSHIRFKKISRSLFDGPYKNIYVAYSNDGEIRKNSTSGGLLTTLILNLIKNNEYDGAFVLNFDKFDNYPARLVLTNKSLEIFNAAKSKYIPASVFNIIKAVKNSNKRYIIVGTPCQILGIKKFLKINDIKEEKLLFFGMFCDKTYNFNLIRYFEDLYKNTREKLIKFEFRTKEKSGWPGDVKLYFDSGRTLIIDRKFRMNVKDFFQLKRCLLCIDKLNRLADISFGDCYVKGKEDNNGKSTVFIRTEKGQKIFSKYSFLFTLESVNIEGVRESQQLYKKMDNLEYAKYYIDKHNIHQDSELCLKSDIKLLKNLSKLEKFLDLGKNYKFNNIRIFSTWFELLNNFKKFKMSLKIGVILGIAFFIEIIKPKHTKKEDCLELSDKNILIVGGNLANKGAQAMTFTTVDQMKRKFPNKDIYLLSNNDFYRGDEEKKIYKFEILPWEISIKLATLGYKDYLKKDRYFTDIENHVIDIIKNASCIIDISGYALSSQFNIRFSIDYLINILIARKFSIPFYIFPQSIGPFKYPNWQKVILLPLIYLYLKYPKKIYVREEEGLNNLRKFANRNTEKRPDIVLLKDKYLLNNIFKQKVTTKLVDIKSNSVGIIPNRQIFKYSEENKLYSLYIMLIDKLIKTGKNVYILKHSNEDYDICKKLKSNYLVSSKVKLISDVLNAIELEDIIKKFDFIIASRYHSIVHAYKNNVPSLILGWATKYYELSKNFGQLDYFIDIRKKIDKNKINKQLIKLSHKYPSEKKEIMNKMSILQNGIVSVFKLFNNN